jgi:hypothetical protein
MPATAEDTPCLPGLSPIRGREIEARFDGGLMSSDGGLLVLREVEGRLDIARRMASCIRDPRSPERILHGLDEMALVQKLRCVAFPGDEIEGRVGGGQVSGCGYAVCGPAF